MKKGFIVIAISFLLIISTVLVGCYSKDSRDIENNIGRIEVLSMDTYYRTYLIVLRDTETDVCYLLVKSQYSSRPVSITLMVDPEGKPLLKT